MRISELLRSRRPFFSFEFFPPKTDEAAEALLTTVSELRSLQPAFVSITYGAGGSTQARSVELVKRVKNELELEVLAHVTCVGASRAQLHDLFADLESSGIENVLALRGDPPRGAAEFQPAPDGYRFASELAAMLEREFRFCIGGACYPETHPECGDPDLDLQHLVTKVNAGAVFLITQLFFENSKYFAFVKRARSAGITVPIIPGIIPITSYEQILRFTSLCGATIPSRLRAELDARADQPDAIESLGVAYATLQCVDLLAKGAPGVHFYTLNKSPATRAVVSALLAA